MNKKQREIIIDAYQEYIYCGMRCDPVGYYSDLHYVFKELFDTDEKLAKEAKEMYNEIPDKL